MAFGVQKETKTQGTGDDAYESNGVTHTQWAVAQFESIDVESTKSKRGDIKEFSSVGVCNFIMNLGWQKQDDQSYATKVPVPAEGEDNSPEELQHMADFADNYYGWVEEKGVQVRKQYRKVRPEAELAVCFDFNEHMLDYNKSPYGKGDENLKPLRISMNGWFNPKKSFNTRVRNTINFKNKKMSENNPLYRVAKAGGVLKSFTESGNVKDGHDYALLAGVVVEFDVTAELSEWEGKKYIEYKLKNPSPVIDVKVKGKVVAAKEDIIKDAKEGIPAFVGIEFDDEGFVYTKEDLDAIRSEFKIIASRAVSFKPSPVKFPDFDKGCYWKDSTLYKACVEHGIWLPPEAKVDGAQTTEQPKQEAQPEVKKEIPAQKPVEATPAAKVVDSEVGEDFDDSEIPF